MKSNMLLLKLLLILFLNCVYVDGRRYPGLGGEGDYLSENQNFYCTHVANSGDDSKPEVQFKIIVESVSMNNPSVPIPDFPIFIFRNSQLKKFDTNFELFIKDGDFWMEEPGVALDVTIKDQFANDDISYFIGNLETSKLNKVDEGMEVLATLNVKESGIYCAVISLPEGIDKLRTKEYALSSHGYLPYQIYFTLHSQLIYCTMLTLLIGLMGFTFYKHGKIYADAAYKGFDSSSVALVFKCFFYFVYIPKYISTVIRYAFYLKANYDPNGSYDQKILLIILDMVDKLLNITNHYVIFLLAAGYGSFYSGLGFGYAKPSSSPTSYHTTMPARFWNRGIQFYILNIICAFLRGVIDKYDDKIYPLYEYFDGVVDGDKHFNAYIFVAPIIDFLNTTFPLLWISTSVLYFFRNLRNISKKVSQSETNSNQYLVKVVRSYRSSIVPILIIPLVFSAISLGIVIKQVNSIGKNSINRPHFADNSSLISEDERLDIILNDSTYTILKLWINYIATLLSMIFTYFFWMKDNVGVKLLSRIGSTEYNQIPMTDFD